MLKSMPNVADLAYARTVGQSIDTLQTEFLEKIAKIEQHKTKEKTDVDREVPMYVFFISKKAKKNMTNDSFSYIVESMKISA